MSDHDMNRTLLALVRAGVLGCKTGLSKLEEAEKKAILNLASKQGILPIVLEPLLKEQLIDKSFFQMQLAAVQRHERMELLQTKVFELFEQNELAFLPLKGALICQYYPQPWMRSRADIDILVSRENLEKALTLLLEHLEFSLISRNYHDVSLRSKGGISLELHFNLLEKEEKLDKVLGLVWQFVDRTEGQIRLNLRPEFFMFHQVSHTAYHFLHGGCGIRFLCDLYLLNKSMVYDEPSFCRLCADAGILEFYRNLQKVIEYWFCDKPADELTLEISEFLISGTLFGTNENKIAMEQGRRGGKMKFIISRLFWSYEDLKIQYPSLEGKKYLTPAYQIVRWFRLLRPKAMQSSITQLQINQNLQPQKVKNLERFMKQVGF